MGNLTEGVAPQALRQYASIACVAGGSWEGDCVAHVGEACDVGDRALEAEAEADLRHRAKTAQIPVPIGFREVRALRSCEMIRDTAATGYAARRQTGKAVTYLVKYRATGGRQRWYRIGRHGAPWTPQSARAEARRI